MNVTKFFFVRPDGVREAVTVPFDLNKAAASKVRLKDYSVYLVSTGRELAESEIVEVKYKREIVGFLIPGQAILSAQNPRNHDRIYAAYSLIAASRVCSDSLNGEYSLSGYGPNAIGVPAPFISDKFYGIFWNSKLPEPIGPNAAKYFVSLARHGLYLSDRAALPRESIRTLEAFGKSLSIALNPEFPDYVRKIVTELHPYTDNPHLCFFYLYQLIEHLMARGYESSLATLKGDFDAQPSLSVTQLKDFLQQFKNIVSEVPRIRAVLLPVHGPSDSLAEALLSSLGESFAELNFADKVYRIRNIMFHDYRRVHDFGQQLEDFQDELMSYLLSNQLSS